MFSTYDMRATDMHHAFMYDKIQMWHLASAIIPPQNIQKSGRLLMVMGHGMHKSYRLANGRGIAKVHRNAYKLVLTSKS